VKFARARRRPRLAELSLTPLIDIVFNLLIFFLMSTTFAERTKLGVELPPADLPPTQPSAADVIVTVNSDGSVFHLGRSVNVDQLSARLRHHREQHPTAALIIDADVDSRHGAVVEVMRTARKLGYDDVAIAADPRAERPR
jgi:biopolymer transport protein ExbD